jgi:DNA-directed RNA polymerase specialized sigma24 family protein
LSTFAGIQAPAIESSRAFDSRLLDMIPSLRAFAHMLEPDRTRAHELVRQTLLAAMAAGPSVIGGSQLRAALVAILRTRYYADRGPHSVDPLLFFATTPRRPVAAGVPIPTGPHDLQRALGRLSVEQTEALLLVDVMGFSYVEAAAICVCAVSSVETRVICARSELRTMLVAGHDDGEAQAWIAPAHASGTGVACGLSPARWAPSNGRCRST